MSDALTERQNEAYEFIRAYHRQHRKPPTYTEIAQALSIRSLNAVVKVLRALEAKGYLTRTPNVARGLTLSAPDDPYALDEEAAPQLPVVSRTSSATPETLRKRPAAYLAVDRSLLPRTTDPDTCLVGRAGDDGMNGDGIRKGDLVVVEECTPGALHPNELAAVLVGEAFLVRRVHLLNGRLHLRVADRRYTEETYPPGDPKCHLVGRVTAVLRRVT